jgi:hypothetical protein
VDVWLIEKENKISFAKKKQNSMCNRKFEKDTYGWMVG